eukprot:GILI01007368.1.p1 GENE.GILI01007368.1~~GILI01007368.1.p1  ORF type:complete len:111 (-),score=33.13 GILI01007368.1:667-999(-)
MLNTKPSQQIVLCLAFLMLPVVFFSLSGLTTAFTQKKEAASIGQDNQQSLSPLVPSALSTLQASSNSTVGVPPATSTSKSGGKFSLMTIAIAFIAGGLFNCKSFSMILAF